MCDPEFGEITNIFDREYYHWVVLETSHMRDRVWRMRDAVRDHPEEFPGIDLFLFDELTALWNAIGNICDALQEDE